MSRRISDDLIKRSDAIKAVDAFLGTDSIVERIKRLPSAGRPQEEWIPSRSACCKTCEYRLDGVKSDHTLLGSVIDIDSDMDGFICLALAYEGVAHWMLGVDEERGICEMYKERSRR